MSKLKQRKIIVGCDEKSKEIVIRDQATLRLINEVINYIPERK